MNEEETKLKEKREKIEKEIVELVSKLKSHSSSELVKKLNLEDENIFQTLEKHNIYEELIFVSKQEEDELMERDEEKYEKIKKYKKKIAKKFEEYYETFFESQEGEQKFKFKYKTVEKKNYGLSTTDILQMDDELLEEALPSRGIKIEDSVGTKLDEKQVAKKVKQLKYMTSEKMENKLSKSKSEKKKKMKRLTRAKLK
jgi:hypothetical protein